jgi:protein-disulfide isomerase
LAVEGKPSHGPIDAEVAILIVSDFQCPFCAKASEAIRDVLQHYPGQVRLSFQNFPLNAHPFAYREAESAACAGEQGLFWQIHDELFRRKPRNEVDSKKAVDSSDLLPSEYDNCMASGRPAETIRRDMAEAVDLGINSVPTIFVNGIMISG